MSAIKYKSLKLKTVTDKVTLPYTVGEKEYNIEVLKYLPIAKKMELISRVINLSNDENRFYNVGKINMYYNIFMVMYYTNITIDQDTLDDPAGLFDELTSSGLLHSILEAIDPAEQNWVLNTLKDSVGSIYKYNNSVLGILDMASKNYENLGIEAGKIQEMLQNPDNLKMVKDILTKLQ